MSLRVNAKPINISTPLLQTPYLGLRLHHLLHALLQTYLASVFSFYPWAVLNKRANVAL